MPKTRVLVVDDSLTARKHLIEVLSADPELEVAGEAEDGKRAIELCRTLRPDVITLDMMLPVMSGLAVTEYVMAYCPTPILVVSSSTNRGELYKTYDALAAGAVDVFEKPSGRDPDGVWERGLVASVKIVSRIRVITHIRGRLGQTSTPPAGFAASKLGAQTAACLLTGMGRDGAAGLLALRHAGALTIAQDEASSVVFGMPREAIQIGAAARVLALDQIAPALTAVAREAELGRNG
jgi:two-component system chemotaxis response regulator CheB